MVRIGILMLTLLLAITERTWGLFILTSVVVAVIAWRTRLGRQEEGRKLDSR
jgi:hypothetical protein